MQAQCVQYQTKQVLIKNSKAITSTIDMRNKNATENVI